MKKQFIILLILSIIGQLAIIPYTLTMQPDALSQIPLPLPLVIILQVVNTIIISSIFIIIGLLLAPRIGLKLPIIDNFVEGKNIKKDMKNILPLSIFSGLLVGFFILFGDYIFTLFGGSVIVESSQIPSAFQGFLASFYGGINEEIMLRLFLMTLIAFILFKIKKSNCEKSSKWIYWSAIMISTFLFAIAHIPITAAIVELTPLIILRSVIFNGIGGMVFGWLYWKRGLESAMISHFSADIILHVLSIFLFY